MPLMEVLVIPLLALVALITWALNGRGEVPERIRPPRVEPVDFAAELRPRGPLPRRFPVGPSRDEYR